MKRSRKTPKRLSCRVTKKKDSARWPQKSLEAHSKSAGRLATLAGPSSAREQALKVPFLREMSRKRTTKALAEFLVDAYVLGAKTRSSS